MRPNWTAEKVLKNIWFRSGADDSQVVCSFSYLAHRFEEVFGTVLACSAWSRVVHQVPNQISTAIELS